MRGICCIGVAVGLALAVPAQSGAQERGSTKSTTKPKRHKKKRSKKPRRSDYIEIEVRSAPRGARIEIDGESMGKAPLKARVPTGRRVIEAAKSGYAEARITLDVEKGMGYLVFALARDAKPVARRQKRRSSGFGDEPTPKMKHSDAITKARLSLKRGKHSDALRYAEAALDSKPADSEAKMIATIASCGVGDPARAKRHLPRRRGSYREIAIKRCDRLGVDLP